MLTREQILAAEDRRRETVDVPEWGGTVLIREMSILDRAACYNVLEAGEGDTRTQADRAAAYSAEMLVRSIIHEDGTLVLQPGDAAALTAKSNRAVTLVVGHIQKLNKIDDPADAEKN